MTYQEWAKAKGVDSHYADFGERVWTAAQEVNYTPLHEFATKHRISYNELCTLVRTVLAAASFPVVKVLNTFKRLKQK